MENKKRSTIRDVAERAGYSITAVSMVLNNKPVSIPQSTREKIWAAAESLNYRPNQLAVSMITKRSRVLGLIIPDNSNLFFAELSKAIEMEAIKRGYGLLYGNTNNDHARDMEYIQMFMDRRVDGIIYSKSASYDREDEKKCLKALQESQVPFVTVDRRLSDTEGHSVLLNHFKGGYLATRHLVELGHKRIGCFTGPPNLFSSNERLEGYISALAEVGIEYDPTLVFEGDYQLGKEDEAARYLMEKGVTAVFVFNDVMAFGLLRALRKEGLSIPDDLSIIGFDNVPFSDLIQPPLSTIAQPTDKIGQQTVNVLLQLVEKGETEEKRNAWLFEPRLIVRESTAPPRKGAVS